MSSYTVDGTTITLTEGVAATIAFQPSENLGIFDYQYSQAQPEGSDIADKTLDLLDSEYLVPTYRFGSLEAGSYKFTLTITNNNDYSTVFQQEYTIQVNPKAEVVIQPEEGAPSVSLSIPEEELLETVLTEEEIAAGNQVQITVAKTEPSQEELDLFTNAMNGYKECIYLDISLAKISQGASTAITEVPGGVRLVLSLPIELQKEGREFVLFREHNGSIEMLRDLDNDTATVTFESDKFSVFALAYVDSWQGSYPSTSKPNSDVAQIGGSGDTTQTGNGNGDANPETGDNNNVGILIALAFVAVCGVIVTTVYSPKKARNK